MGVSVQPRLVRSPSNPLGLHPFSILSVSTFEQKPADLKQVLKQLWFGKASLWNLQIHSRLSF